MALVHLTSESIRTWYHGLGSEHIRRNCTPMGCCTPSWRPPSPTNYHRNPARSCGHEPGHRTAAGDPDTDEVATLAEAIKPERLRALVLVLAWTGALGEAIELRRGDVAEGAKAIRVSGPSPTATAAGSTPRVRPVVR